MIQYGGGFDDIIVGSVVTVVLPAAVVLDVVLVNDVFVVVVSGSSPTSTGPTVFGN
jgi:hypothetical protein